MAAKHQGHTNTTIEVKLTSSIQQVMWSRLMAAPGASVGLEVFTQFVGNGADLEIKLTDNQGTNHGTFKDKLSANQFIAQIQVPVKAETALFADVKLPKHGLSMKSGALLLGPPVEITNVKWDRREVRYGDILKLTADVEGPPDGREAVITIWEKDDDGAHDLVAQFPGLVQNGKIEAEWEFVYPGDISEDIPTIEECENEYVPPAFFFRVEINGVRAASDEVVFDGWIGIELVDADGDPVPGERYVLELPDGTYREGVLDEKGRAVVVGVDPGTCLVTFPDAASDQQGGLDQ